MQSPQHARQRHHGNVEQASVCEHAVEARHGEASKRALRLGYSHTWAQAPGVPSVYDSRRSSDRLYALGGVIDLGQRLRIPSSEELCAACDACGDAITAARRLRHELTNTYNKGEL